MKETKLKILQYITGIGLFFFVGAHMIVSHIGSGEPTSWESVSERAASGGWLTLYLLLLLFGIYHGLHGLRTVVLELSSSTGKILDRVLVTVGIVVFAYAAYIPISAF